jgi:hypothetical protein
MERQWNDIDRENQKTWRKTCPGATLSTKKPTWTTLGINPGLCGEKLATICLSCGMAYTISLSLLIK